jgi:hypothetical protein
VLRLLPWLLIAAGAAHAQPSGSPRFRDAASRDAVEQARAAVLGSRPIEGFRSLRLTGRLRVGVSRDEAVDGQVDIRVLLPDRYLRVDTLKGVARRAGFAGRALLTEKGDIRAEYAGFARLLLGLAAIVPAEPKLTFESTGESAFADTIAVDVTGTGLSGRLVFDSATHVPLRLVYDSRYGAGTVMSFANRRDVDGVTLPSRVTTLIADRVLETLMFDDIQVNPDFRDADFRR